MSFKLPEIPHSWLIAAILIGLIVLRFISLDTWITAALSTIIGYLVGVKLEQIRITHAPPQEVPASSL